MADETKLTAATRIEKLLDNIAGGENEVTPATRLEKFLSYIADAMEGGGGSGGGGHEDCVKILNVEQIDRSDHSDAPVYVYTENDGWTNIATDYAVIANTESDIPVAYVTNDPVSGVSFPLFIATPDFVTGETHTPSPELGNKSGYYIEYADAYSIYGSSVFSVLIIKNGVVNYFQGLG